MYSRLGMLIEKAGENADVDVVILSAKGKNFSAGNDLHNFNLVDFSTAEVIHYNH